MNLRKCKSCGELKPESEFYTIRNKQRNKVDYYECLTGKCKTCILQKAKIRYAERDKVKMRTAQIKTIGINISDTNYQCVSVSSEYDFVFSHLKRYGNCFISRAKSRLLNYEELEEKLQKKIISKAFENGYILEVRKYENNV